MKNLGKKIPLFICKEENDRGLTPRRPEQAKRSSGSELPKTSSCENAVLPELRFACSSLLWLSGHLTRRKHLTFPLNFIKKAATSRRTPNNDSLSEPLVPAYFCAQGE